MEINGENTLMFTGFLMKMCKLMRLGPAWEAPVAKITPEGSTSGFELTLVSSREDSRRHVIEAIKPLDRHTALKTLRTCGLTAAVVPKSILVQGERDGDDTREANAAARIRFVRLTPGQVLSVFDEIRRRDANVRELYANLRGKDFDLIRDKVRGAVIRAYAAEGVARGEGIVMELPHKRADGTEAVFNVSIKDGMTGEGEAGSGEVEADYAIRRGKQIETYKIKAGRTHLVRRAKTSRQTGIG